MISSGFGDVLLALSLSLNVLTFKELRMEGAGTVPGFCSGVSGARGRFDCILKLHVYAPL